MRNRGLMTGTAVIAAFCLVYAGVALYSDHSEKKAKESLEAEKIYMTDLSDVKTISYQINGTELSFTKEGETWYYDGDKDFPLQQSKLSILSDNVKKLEAVRKLDGGDEFAAYGLDEPVRVVKAASSDGGSVTINLGKTTDDGNYYAVKEGDTTAYLIGPSLFDETSYVLEDLIALEEFPAITGTDIQEIHITKDGNTWNYRKQQEDSADTVVWYQATDHKESTKLESNSQLNVLADTISGFAFSGFADYKAADESLALYGLLNPTAKISYRYLKNGEEQSLTLSIGGLNEDGTSYYTRMNDSSAVNEIDKNTIDKCFLINGEITEED